jgi:hypothetical protein
MYYFGVLSNSVSFVTILRNFVESFYWKQAIKCHYMSTIFSINFAFHKLHAQLASFPVPRTNVPSSQERNLLLHMIGPWNCPCSGRIRHRTTTTGTGPDTLMYCCNSECFRRCSICLRHRTVFLCTNGCIPNCEFSCFNYLYLLYSEKWMWSYKIFPKLPLHVYEYWSMLVLWPHKTALCLYP